jgi:integrase
VFNDFIEALEDKRLPPISNPVRTRLFLREPLGRTRYLTDDEEARLRKAVPADAWRVVLVALHTGLDRGEQLGLRWGAQVDFTTRTIHAERRKGRRAGPIPVIIPINDELLAVLRTLPSRGRSRWLFPNPENTGPMDGRAFDRLVFRPALARAGIRDFRWKDLRHSFATRLRMAGADTGTIRDLLGHTSDRMTQRYAHAAPGHLHAAVQRISRSGVSSGVSPETENDQNRPKATETHSNGNSERTGTCA